jgi:hypothetical protein
MAMNCLGPGIVSAPVSLPSKAGANETAIEDEQDALALMPTCITPLSVRFISVAPPEAKRRLEQALALNPHFDPIFAEDARQRLAALTAE